MKGLIFLILFIGIPILNAIATAIQEANKENKEGAAGKPVQGSSFTREFQGQNSNRVVTARPVGNRVVRRAKPIRAKVVQARPTAATSNIAGRARLAPKKEPLREHHVHSRLEQVRDLSDVDERELNTLRHLPKSTAVQRGMLTDIKKAPKKLAIRRASKQESRDSSPLLKRTKHLGANQRALIYSEIFKPRHF